MIDLTVDLGVFATAMLALYLGLLAAAFLALVGLRIILGFRGGGGE